jgi:pimeloyl-ACP methyl ester carboxylesterase
VCAYNIACAHTIAGDVDAGLVWIGRAIELDAGRSPELTATIERDSDTAPLRADPRGQALLEKLRASARQQDPPPRSFVPAGAVPAAGWPLSVVLLEGPTSDARFSEWVDRARTMGLALLAPSAHWRLGASESEGRAWVAMVSDFAKRPWAYEEPIVTALTTFSEDHSIDPGRVFVVGEGSGALVAFDLAARAPGLVRGALLVEGPVHPALSIESATTAARSGSMVRALVGRSVAEGQALLLYERFLEHCGFGAASARAIEGASDREARIDAALAELLALSPQQR